MTVQLNRRLTLEAASRVPDGAGGYAETWVVLGEHWADIRPGAGVDAAGDMVAVASLPLRIIVRAAPEGSLARPRPEQRFREGGRVYRILAVAETDARGHYLTCFAREEAAT